MTESRPTLNDWQKLYQAAMRIKEMAPWEWMDETDIFGVQDPETGEIGFVSIMGTLGEHLAVAVYLGAEALYRFWRLQEVAESEFEEVFLGISQLQVSFEDRAELTQKDRDVIKELGLKFRGRQAWPMFRSFRPGYWPWYLEAPEARTLAYALEQAAEMALRFQGDPSVLEPPDGESYLVRVPRKVEGHLVWEDEVVRVFPPVEPESIPVVMDLEALEQVKQLPREEHTLEIDFSLFPIRIEERGARPYPPYMLLVVDSGSGMILGTELLGPELGLAEMWGSVPVKVVYQIGRMGVLPRRINARSPKLLALLRLLAEELGIEVEVEHRLPDLERAQEALMHRFG
jgi:hypothetical protein